MDITLQNREFEIILQTNDDKKKQHSVRMKSQNGKVGMMIGYKNLQINTNKKIQYSGLEAIKMG